MTRTWLRHPVYVAGLAIVWMVLNGRFSVADFLVGYAVGAIVTWIFRDFWIPIVRVRRPDVALRLALRFAREVVVANVQVAWVVVQPRLRVRPAFIQVPLELDDDVRITMLASMITLTPGTLTVDLAPDRSALWVHCLSITDAAVVRAEIERHFQRPLARAITCSPS